MKGQKKQSCKPLLRRDTVQTFARSISDALNLMEINPAEMAVSAVVYEKNSEWLLSRLLVDWGSEPVMVPDHGHIVTQRGEPKTFTRLDTLVRQLQTAFPGFKSIEIRIEHVPSSSTKGVRRHRVRQSAK